MTTGAAGEWRPGRLGDHFKIKHGYAFKGEHFRTTGDLILLTPGSFEVYGGLKTRSDGEKYYDGPVPSEFLLDRGDLLVVMTDLTQNAPILGAPAFVPEASRYLHNQRLGKVVELDESELAKEYLYYLLSTPNVRAQIRATATGATVKHTAPERIYAVRVLLPPIQDQRNVANCLRAYERLIENNSRRIRILSDMVRLIYTEWFVKFRFPGHESAQKLDSSSGPLPEGWDVTTVGAAVRTVGGGTPSTKSAEYWDGGSINWYTPSDLTSANSMFVVESEKKITADGLRRSSATLFPPHSVMLTSRATIGVIAVNTVEACTNQGFITCIPSDRLTYSQLYFWLERSRETILNLATGATYREISRSTFRSMPIVVPPVAVATAYSALVNPMLRQIEALQREKQVLRETWTFLLPRLMTGVVDSGRLREHGETAA